MALASLTMAATVGLDEARVATALSNEPLAAWAEFVGTEGGLEGGRPWSAG